MGKDLPSTAGVPSPYPYPATPAIQSASALYALVVPLYGAPTKLWVTPASPVMRERKGWKYGRAIYGPAKGRASILAPTRALDRAILLGAIAWHRDALAACLLPRLSFEDFQRSLPSFSLESLVLASQQTTPASFRARMSRTFSAQRTYSRSIRAALKAARWVGVGAIRGIN